MTTALITNIPAPYRQPLYGELSRNIGDFVVLYEASGAGARDWGRALAGGYDHLILNQAPIEQVSHVRRAQTVRGALAHRRPDVVVATGFGAAALAAREWCAERRVPFVGLSGATGWADREVTGVREALRARLARSAAGWIAYGPEARRYLIDLGADPAKVMAAGNPYGIEPRQGERDTGVGARRIGFAGQLHWRKAWWVPLKAAAIAMGQGAEFGLSMLGNGPGAGLLRALMDETPSVRVEWRPKQPPARMHEFYDEIDILVVPSLSDQWPIVASEAAARGVPAICTPETVSGLPDELATAGSRPRPGSVHGVARALLELHDRDGYARALRRVPAAREASDPAAVAGRWANHLRALA